MHISHAYISCIYLMLLKYFSDLIVILIHSNIFYRLPVCSCVLPCFLSNDPLTAAFWPLNFCINLLSVWSITRYPFPLRRVRHPPLSFMRHTTSVSGQCYLSPAASVLLGQMINHYEVNCPYIAICNTQCL